MKHSAKWSEVESVFTNAITVASFLGFSRSSNLDWFFFPPLNFSDTVTTFSNKIILIPSSPFLALQRKGRNSGRLRGIFVERAGRCAPASKSGYFDAVAFFFFSSEVGFGFGSSSLPVGETVCLSRGDE